MTDASQPSLVELSRRFKDPDYHVRVAAVDRLAALGAAALELLVEALGDFDDADEESRVNRHASHALGQIGAPAVPRLIQAVQAEQAGAWQRYWACETLGDLGDERAVPPLIEALQSGDTTVCEGAAEALGRLGDPRALEPLRRKKRTLTPRIGYLYVAVARALKAIEARAAAR